MATILISTENQLTKFKLCPQLPYFCPPRISVTHFASPGVPLDAPDTRVVHSQSHPLCTQDTPGLSFQTRSRHGPKPGAISRLDARLVVPVFVPRVTCVWKHTFWLTIKRIDNNAAAVLTITALLADENAQVIVSVRCTTVTGATL